VGDTLKVLELARNAGIDLFLRARCGDRGFLGKKRAMNKFKFHKKLKVHIPFKFHIKLRFHKY
jgi:hypothetical protein